MKRRAAALVLACVLGCGDDPRDGLASDIAKLKQERVEKGMEENAVREADAAEASLARAKAALDARRTAAAAVEAKRDALRAELEREAARGTALEADARRQDARAQSAMKEAEELEGRLAAERQRAARLRDQAAVLAREMRPGDPAWAVERRMQSLRQLLAHLAQQYPADPVLAELAQEKPSPEAAAAAAMRARDRLNAVYDLAAPEIAAPPP